MLFKLISLIAVLTFSTEAHAEKKPERAQKTSTDSSGIKTSRSKKSQNQPFRGNRSPAVLPPTQAELKSQTAQ